MKNKSSEIVLLGLRTDIWSTDMLHHDDSLLIVTALEEEIELVSGYS